MAQNHLKTAQKAILSHILGMAQKPPKTARKASSLSIFGVQVDLKTSSSLNPRRPAQTLPGPSNVVPFWVGMAFG